MNVPPHAKQKHKTKYRYLIKHKGVDTVVCVYVYKQIDLCVCGCCCCDCCCCCCCCCCLQGRLQKVSFTRFLILSHTRMQGEVHIWLCEERHCDSSSYLRVVPRNFESSDCYLLFPNIEVVMFAQASRFFSVLRNKPCTKGLSNFGKQKER